jgi:hypothetical protein
MSADVEVVFTPWPYDAVACGKPASECGAMVPLFDGSALFRCDSKCKEASA